MLYFCLLQQYVRNYNEEINPVSVSITQTVTHRLHCTIIEEARSFLILMQGKYEHNVQF